MGEIKNEIFDIEFIARTKNVIQEYKGTYNITLLLNCLLGLIILPSEYYKRRARIFFEKDISEFKELKGLLENATFNPTKRKNNLIKKVRNGVSHQQIECVGNKGKWARVILKDINAYNQNSLELQVNWTIKQLRTFALFVADSYLTEITKIENKKK